MIIGDDSVMIIDAQATPRLANMVVEKVRSVTDKHQHVVLTHYHAVRVLGASAYGASQVIMSEKARSMVVERGQEDWDSEFGRFPRLFQGHESIPGLTWPTTTFNKRMSVYLGKRRVDLMHLGRAHTAGDIVAYVGDENVMLPAISLNIILRVIAAMGTSTIGPKQLKLFVHGTWMRLRRAVGMRLWAKRWSMLRSTILRILSAQLICQQRAWRFAVAR